MYMHTCVGKERSLIQCDICRLYFHVHCVGLQPSTNHAAFTCPRCRPAAARRRDIPRPAIGHRREHVTLEMDSVNCDDSDLLEDFFDSKNGGSVTKKTNCSDVEDDDDDDDADDCIMID